MGSKVKPKGRITKARLKSLHKARLISQLNIRNKKNEIQSKIDETEIQSLVDENENLPPIYPSADVPPKSNEELLLDCLRDQASPKCGNCGFAFPDESYKKRRLENIEEYEIDILDAILYIYGLTPEDWTRALLLNAGSECTTIPNTFFNDGINFCDKCAEALGSVYKAHISWKEMSADDSLVAKTINLKSGGLAVLDTNEQEIKSEIDYSENTDEIPTIDFEKSVESEECFYEYDPLEPDNSEAEGTSDIKLTPCNDSIDIPPCPSSDESFATTRKSLRLSSKRMLSNRADKTSNEIKTYSKSVLSSSMRRKAGVKAQSNRKEMLLNENTNMNRLKWKYQNIRSKKEGAAKNSVVFGPIECCGISFKEESVFNEHCETIERKCLDDSETPAHKVKCNICEAIVRASYLRRHYQESHGPKKVFSCDICDFKFFLYGNLVKHKKLHEPSAKNVETLNGDQTTPDDFGPVECCRIPFRDTNLFLKHKRCLTQLNGTVWIKHKAKCLICQTNLNLNSVLDHMTTVHGQKDEWQRRAHKPVEVYNCNICGSKYLQVRNYINHQKTHEEGFQKINYQPKHQCDICGKPDLFLSQLMDHKDTHDPSINCACDICGIICKSMRRLQDHKLRTHENRNYHCDKCPKTFGTNNLLKIHKECHDLLFSTKQFVCEKCGEGFSRARKLRLHLVKHDDQESSREFKCPHCSKKLKHRYSLKKHIREQHKSTNLFICEQCGKTTKNSTNMRIHMQVHDMTRNIKRPYQPKISKKLDPKQIPIESNADIFNSKPVDAEISPSSLDAK